MSRLLTLKEIAKDLDIPESSLRKYREIFSPFIPSVGTGRSRRYRTEAIQILNDIRKMREDMHMPWDTISESLAEKYPMNATPESENGVAGAQGSMYQGSELETSSLAGSQGLPAAPISSGQFMRKLAAMNERQTMMVNAIAMELIRSMETVRTEAGKDAKQLQANIVRTMENLSHSMDATNQQEIALLRDIQSRIDSISEKTDPSSPPAHDNTEKFAQMQEALKIVKTRLQQREKAMIEYKQSIEILKKENAKLRDFKQQHTRKTEEYSLEKKASRQSSFFQKLFGK